MNPQVLELPSLICLTTIAYGAWRLQQLSRRKERDRNGPRREIWDEVEGKVNSIGFADDVVTVEYEFLTPAGTQHAEHRFKLEVAPPYSFGTREADLRQAAQQFLLAYRVGHPARVRYNPKRVTECVLARPRPLQVGVEAKRAERATI